MSETLDKILILILFLATFSVVGICCYLVITTTNSLIEIQETQEDIKDAISGLEERQLYNDTLASTTVAQYRPDTQTIQLFSIKDNSIYETEKNFYHELGHKIWYEYITKEDKTKYIFLFNTTNSFVSDYSRSSLIESFAEDYSYYRMNLTINKDKLIIMEKYR